MRRERPLRCSAFTALVGGFIWPPQAVLAGPLPGCAVLGLSKGKGCAAGGLIPELLCITGRAPVPLPVRTASGRALPTRKSPDVGQTRLLQRTGPPALVRPNVVLSSLQGCRKWMDGIPRRATISPGDSSLMFIRNDLRALVSHLSEFLSESRLHGSSRASFATAFSSMGRSMIEYRTNMLCVACPISAMVSTGATPALVKRWHA